MVSSIAENGGRSCVNASGVWTTAHARRDRGGAGRAAGRDPARAPRTTRRPSSRRSPTRGVAERISRHDRPRAARARRARRDGARTAPAAGVVDWEGATYLLPTIVLCESPDHPLANREFLFPFASVVPVTAEEMPARPGADAGAHRASPRTRRCVERLLASPLVHRLNLGPHAHLAGELGPAARGQPVRAPLRCAARSSGRVGAA